MMKIYNKLVRDKIPDIIAQEGRTCETVILDDEAYKQALLDKLVEEAQEVQSANENDLLTEIADLYEVVDALMVAYGVNKEEVLRTQAERREERGGFEGRVKLVSTG